MLHDDLQLALLFAALVAVGLYIYHTSDKRDEKPPSDDTTADADDDAAADADAAAMTSGPPHAAGFPLRYMNPRHSEAEMARIRFDGGKDIYEPAIKNMWEDRAARFADTTIKVGDEGRKADFGVTSNDFNHHLVSQLPRSIHEKQAQWSDKISRGGYNTSPVKGAEYEQAPEKFVGLWTRLRGTYDPTGLHTNNQQQISSVTTADRLFPRLLGRAQTLGARHGPESSVPMSMVSSFR